MHLYVAGHLDLISKKSHSQLLFGEVAVDMNLTEGPSPKLSNSVDPLIIPVVPIKNRRPNY